MSLFDLIVVGVTVQNKNPNSIIYCVLTFLISPFRKDWKPAQTGTRLDEGIVDTATVAYWLCSTIGVSRFALICVDYVSNMIPEKLEPQPNAHKSSSSKLTSMVK